MSQSDISHKGVCQYRLSRKDKLVGIHRRRSLSLLACLQKRRIGAHMTSIRGEIDASRCILKMTKAGSGVPRSRPLMDQGSRSWDATDTEPWVIVPLLVCYTHAWPAWRNQQHKHLSSVYSKRRQRLQSPALNPLLPGDRPPPWCPGSANWTAWRTRNRL